MAGHDTFNTLVQEDRMELLLRYPFYGRVICQCELVPVQSPNAPIACNDCRRIYLSETAYTTLPPDDRLLILVHEVLHITLRHAFRKGNRDEERFNFAADAEIYPLLRDEFPQAALRGYKKAWDGLTSEEIYEQLPKKLPEPPPMHCYPSNTPSRGSHPEKGNGAPQSGDTVPCGNSGNPAEAGQDADDTKSENSTDREGNFPGEDDAQPESNVSGEGAGDEDGQDNPQDQEAGQSKGDSSGDGQEKNACEEADGRGTGSNTTDSADGDISESCRTARQPSFDPDAEMFCRNLSAEAQLELRTREGRGDVPGNLLRLLEKINTAHIDWKSLLRQFIREVRGGSYHWLPPNRRFIGKGLYLPGRRQKMFRGVVALDTSGSTIEELPGFVCELECLMRSFGKFELTVIECDASIGNVTVVSSDTRPHDWHKHRFSGGGGTDFTPVFEYIKNKRLTPNVLVFFTDGEGSCPRMPPGYPVLWLLTDNGKPPVPWGVPIKLKG